MWALLLEWLKEHESRIARIEILFGGFVRFVFFFLLLNVNGGIRIWGEDAKKTGESDGVCNLFAIFANMSKEKSAIRERARTGYDEPKRYNVIIFNDDFTTMDFVVEVLMKIFGKSFEEAKALMLSVHNEGKAVAGTYGYDLAVSKASVCTHMARMNKFPLKFEVEEE